MNYWILGPVVRLGRKFYWARQFPTRQPTYEVVSSEDMDTSDTEPRLTEEDERLGIELLGPYTDKQEAEAYAGLLSAGVNSI